jgi:hypothetical protein
MKKEIDILTTAANRFELNTGIPLIVERLLADPFRDAVIEFHWENKKLRFDAEVKANINMASVGLFQQNLVQHKFKNDPVLVTPYVQPAIAQHLRTIKINFLDAAGNVYLCKPPILIDIRGNRPDEMHSTINRLFRYSGLKILFALFCNPGLENADYRTIAAKAGVALGTVGWIMRDLRQSAYLLTLGKNARTLTRKEELLTKWVSAYHEQLRPKIIIGHYSAVNTTWWKNILPNHDVLWGGEVAAGMLTKYLQPEQYTLYVKELRPEFLLTNKLLSNSVGSIEILKKFWFFEDLWTTQNMVPPLLIYADLIASRVDRNIETAKIIYDKELTGLIRQD